MSQEHTKKKAELEQLLADAKAKGKAYENVSNELAKYARLSTDVATPMYEVVSRMPVEAVSFEDLFREVETWKLWHQYGPDLPQLQTDVRSFAANTLSAASTSTGVMIAITQSDFQLTELEAVKMASAQLKITLDHFPLVEIAKTSMKRLGFDASGGSHRSPLDHFEDACAALERPGTGGGSPVHVLIALRECINTGMGNLLQRRSTQAPASKLSGKVLSIGGQCGRRELPLDYFSNLASRADRIFDALSDGKQAQMSRDQLKERFNNTLLFLNAFWEGLDETCLKPGK